MNVLIVDNDRESLCNLENCIKRCRMEDNIISFLDSALAMDYLKEHEVDILFTEVKMTGISGFSLVKSLKKKGGNPYIVFVTATPEYAMNAWEAHVSGYILKPVDDKRIEAELEYAVVMLQNR